MKLNFMLYLIILSISNAFADSSKSYYDYPFSLHPAKDTNQYHCKILQEVGHKAMRERFIIGLSLNDVMQDTLPKVNKIYDTTEFSKDHTPEFRAEISRLTRLVILTAFKVPYPKTQDELAKSPITFERQAYMICMDNLKEKPF